MISRILKCVIILTLVFSSPPLYAQDDRISGVVSGVQGQAYLTDERGDARLLRRDDHVRIGDRIRTDRGGRVRIRFQDNTVLALGEGANVTISDYQWSEKKKKGRFNIDFVHGFFRIIGGIITKNSPENFKMQTPVAILGIRGTSFAGQVSTAGLQVFLESGKGVDVVNRQGAVALLAEGMGTTVPGDTKIPQAPRLFKPEQMQWIIDQSSIPEPNSVLKNSEGRVTGTGMAPGTGSGSGNQGRVSGTIVNQSRISGGANIVKGQGNTGNMGGVRIKSSDVPGEVINESDLSNVSNTAEGRGNVVNTGSVDID